MKIMQYLITYFDIQLLRTEMQNTLNKNANYFKQKFNYFNQKFKPLPTNQTTCFTLNANIQLLQTNSNYL